MTAQARNCCQPPRRVWRLLAPWLLFYAFLLWGWRVRDIFGSIPSYGDVLEVLWGIAWYRDAIVLKHVSPLYTSLVFHPNGWQTATLAHTPVFFLLTLPLYELGGTAFAYNSLAILALLAAFAGAFRFVRLFASRFAATNAALVFTFMGMHWMRAGGGHLNVLWVSSLLPWLAWELERIRRIKRAKSVSRLVLVSGVVWGLMVNSSLYGIFLGGVTFSIWGRQILTWRRIKQGIQIAAIALLVGAPSSVLYAVGTRQDPPLSFGVSDITYLGASLNSLPIPSVVHPLDFIRQFARAWYAGPYDESGVANLGLVTCLLGSLGLFMTIKRREHAHLIWPALTGIILALGLFLKWDGQILRSPAFQPFDAFIWRVGHVLKPDLFAAPSPESGFRRGVPLPGFVLAATVPVFESARTMSRYIFVAALGLVALSAYGLQKLPRTGRYLLAVIWLVEVLPNPTTSQTVPIAPHPAYAWLAQQDLGPGEGIVDIKNRTIMIGGETLFATSLHGKPTASGVGSFWPQHTRFLQDYLSTNDQVLSSPESAWVFRQYGIRYVFFHLKEGKDDGMWNLVSRNPAFQPIQCFDPPPAPSPWPWPICVAEVKAPALPINLLRRAGWSGDEAWGAWSEGPTSEAQWIATSLANYTLALEAFPFCLPDKRQTISISVNGHSLSRYEWETCDAWLAKLVIPRSLTRIGWNTLSFEYGYAVSPAQVTNGENPDTRLLAAGFKKLEVRK